jgi:hypothetical protein
VARKDRRLSVQHHQAEYSGRYRGTRYHSFPTSTCRGLTNFYTLHALVFASHWIINHLGLFRHQSSPSARNCFHRASAVQNVMSVTVRGLYTALRPRPNRCSARARERQLKARQRPTESLLDRMQGGEIPFPCILLVAALLPPRAHAKRVRLLAGGQHWSHNHSQIHHVKISTSSHTGMFSSKISMIISAMYLTTPPQSESICGSQATRGRATAIELAT